MALSKAEGPFGRPFDRLTVLSKVEGLTVLSRVEELMAQALGFQTPETMRENRSILLIPLSLGLLVLFPGYSLAASDYEESLVTQRACGLSGVPCSNKAFEAKQIDRFSDKVSRNKGDLQLKLASGSSITLTNSSRNNERLKVFWFITYYQHTGYFLVQVRGWEGFAYWMINASSGAFLRLSGVPIISRDLKRFVVTSLDLDAGYRPNRIAVFRFGGEGIKQEWSKDYTASGPSGALWLNNSVITYFENTSRDGGQTLNKQPINLELKEGEWRISIQQKKEE